MADSTWWWLLAGAMVALELFTGTFYLLMIAVGLVAAALAAHAGLPSTWQFLAAALVGSALVVFWYFKKKRQDGDPSVRSLRSVNLDIGEIVQIEHWQSDGTAQVRYRGAQWSVIIREGVLPTPGPHRVVELVGNRLLVDKA